MPRPRRTFVPAPTAASTVETRNAAPLPTQAATTGPPKTITPATVRTAATGSTVGRRLDTLLRVVVGLAVVLGIGGGMGLYLTRGKP